MLPEWVSNPGPLTYESGALPIALRGLATAEGFITFRAFNTVEDFIKCTESVIANYV